jgi:hypothetical protein
VPRHIGRKAGFLQYATLAVFILRKRFQ